MQAEYLRCLYKYRCLARLVCAKTLAWRMQHPFGLPSCRPLLRRRDREGCQDGFSCMAFSWKRAVLRSLVGHSASPSAVDYLGRKWLVANDGMGVGLLGCECCSGFTQRSTGFGGISRTLSTTRTLVSLLIPKTMKVPGLKQMLVVLLGKTKRAARLPFG